MTLNESKLLTQDRFGYAISPQPNMALPLDVLVCVMEQAPNLATLYDMVCASPTFLKLFRSRATELIETVMARSVPRELRCFVRWIVLLSSRGAGARLCRVKASTRGAPRYFGTEPLDPRFNGTPGPMYVLLIAKKIEKLEFLCLAKMMEIVSQNVSQSSNTELTFEQNPSRWNSGATDTARTTPTAPSYHERFRVRRSLWRLFTDFTILTMSNAKRPSPQVDNYHFLWDLEDWAKLGVYGGPKAMTNGTFNIDELDSVFYTLVEILGGSVFFTLNFFTGKWLPEIKLAVAQEALTNMAASTDPCRVWEFDDSVAANLSKFDNFHETQNPGKVIFFESTSSDGTSGNAPAPDATPSDQPDDDDNTDNLDGETLVSDNETNIDDEYVERVDGSNWGMLYCRGTFLQDSASGVLTDQDIRSFGCLGLSIWDRSRLAGFDLACAPQRHRQNPSPFNMVNFDFFGGDFMLLFAWRRAIGGELLRIKSRKAGMQTITNKAMKQLKTWCAPARLRQ